MGHGNETSTVLDYPHSLYHDPFDVSRLITAARRALNAQVGETHPRECYRAFCELSAALDAFSKDSPSEPVPPGGGRYCTDREYREHIEATTLTPAEYRRFASFRKGVIH